MEYRHFNYITLSFTTLYIRCWSCFPSQPSIQSYVSIISFGFHTRINLLIIKLVYHLSYFSLFHFYHSIISCSLFLCIYISNLVNGVSTTNRVVNKCVRWQTKPNSNEKQTKEESQIWMDNSWLSEDLTTGESPSFHFSFFS